MQKGDLSNELTKRVLITLDTFRTEEVEIKKAFKILPVVKRNYKFDRQTLSRLYLFADRTMNTLELVGFDMSDSDLESIIEDIEKIGTNPFRYFTAYESIEHLVAELPYRPEVAGVIDVPARLLRYGHWGWDFSRL